jgi:hypothetical protein
MSSSDHPQRRAQELLQRMTITGKALQVCSVMPTGALDTGGALASGSQRRCRTGSGTWPGSACSAISLRSSGTEHLPVLPDTHLVWLAEALAQPPASESLWFAPPQLPVRR